MEKIPEGKALRPDGWVTGDERFDENSPSSFANMTEEYFEQVVRGWVLSAFLIASLIS